MKRLFFKSIIAIVLLSVALYSLSACNLDILSGHKHTLNHVAEKQSTCKEQGNNEYWYCAGCKKYFSDENAQNATTINSIKKSIAPHSYTDWQITKEATETSDGLKERACTVCGEKESLTINKLPHTHSTTLVKASDSTCKDPGNIEYWRCTICNALFLDQSASQKTSVESVKKPLASHTYGEWEVTNAATEESEGLKVRICSICYIEDKQVINKLPHTHKYADEWTYDSKAHWIAATCCSDAPRKDYATHTLTIENICLICGYDATAIDIAKFSKGTYGYSTLNKSEQAFYDKIDEVISKFHLEGNAKAQNSGGNSYYTLQGISYSEVDLTKENALNVYKVYKADNPLYYWLGTTTLFTNTEIFPVVINDYASEELRKQTNELLYKKINEYYYIAKADDSDYRKALAYHDAIIDAINYAYDENGVPSSEEWAHSVLGVFLNGSGNIKGAVCEGYAKAFQLLLNLVKIDNLTVSGVGVTATGSEGHLWNMVKLDGLYYYFDLTWDDQPLNGRGRIYNYFCANANQVATTHYPNVSLSGGGLVNDKLYDLPINIATTEYDCKDAIYSSFILDDITYVICGYNEVQLVACAKTNVINLVNSVTYNAHNYNLVCIGSVYGNVNILSSVFNSGAVEITIPENVDFIWDCAFRCNTLKSITVNSNNQYFSDDKGILYTKNKYTLIYFPARNTNSNYTIASNCKIIALYAFEYGNLISLTLPQSVTEFYIPNYGVGYADNITEYEKRLTKITTLCATMPNEAMLTFEQFTAKVKISNVKRIDS